jgi:uncharacterized membrane protein YphA (DoxX/SURF4 family)
MEGSRLSCKLIQYKMQKLFENKTVVIIIRVILGGLFMYSSFDKMANPEAFADIIDNYRLLPVQLVNPMAIFLPWLEFITGLLLLTGKWVKGSLLIYSSLLVIFIIALAQALIRGLDISCGCFSVQSSTTSDIWLRIILDIVMLFFSINLYRYTEEESSVFDEEEESANLT